MIKIRSAPGARGARGHLLVWLTVLMTVLSLSPAAMQVAAAQEQPPAQAEQQYLEVHVVECPPGTTGTGGDFYNACHENGLEGVDLQVTSVDPALNINQDKTTTRIQGAGPGIINTGDIPAGEYQVTVDLPTDTNAFWIYCSVADGDTVVPTTPDDAASATITLTGEDVVCDWYVIPQEQAADTATLTFDVRSCDRNDLDGDDRSWEQLSANCTDLPDESFEIELGLPNGETDRESPDAEGQVEFEGLEDGDYPLRSNIDLNEAGQYLFCEYEGQPRYEKEFDQGGTTQFTNLLGEEISCDWFVVSVPEEPGPAPAEPTATAAAPTETPVQPAQAPVQPAEEPVEAQQVAGSIAVTLHACPQGYDVSANGETHPAFAENCAAPVSDVVMTLTDTANGNTNQQVSDADGQVAYPDLPPGTYTLYSSIPLEAATEYLFCVSEGVDYQKDFSDRGVTTFTNLETEQIACDWYVVPADLRGEENGGSLTVHLAACPQEYTGDRLFDDCHGNGIDDQQFTLTGPAGELTATTSIPASPGPGIATFTQLPAGDYTLMGGPPGDFGRVRLYCSDQATNERIESNIESTIGTFSIGENQDILCDWYYIPENASGITPTPTPTETPRAEILVTLFACPPTSAESGYAGATFSQLDEACADPVNDVTFSLSSGGAVPLSAATGVSGPGAVRFYDLLPSDYTLAPSLPSDLTNVAVFCQLDGGDVYQKSIQNGATTFVNVEGEEIACSWFAAPVRAPQPSGPTGSITVRELLCEKDRSEITDWEKECVPGSTGTSFTLASSDGAINLTAAPNAEGVLVFSQLPDGYYDLQQDEGVWCRAVAERVDSRSRVIVRDGGNTDVFLYQCGQINTLPSTGTGAGTVDDGGLTPATIAALILATLAAPVFAAGALQSRRLEPRGVPVEEPRHPLPEQTGRGTHRMRFR